MARRTASIRADLGGAGGAVALPVLVHGGERPGPVVAVTANVHGDELTGLLAVHALDRLLTDASIAGRVLLHPSLNPSGLAIGSRALPADGGDLNRAFPGRLGGAPVERLASAVWAHMEREHVEVLVDLHADSLASVPYAIVDRIPRVPRAAQDGLLRSLRELARATGLLVLHEYPDTEYARYRLDRSLAGAFVNNRRCRAITVESGGRGAVQRHAVDVAVGATLGVLRALGVVDLPAPGDMPSPPAGPWRRGPPPRTKCDGVMVRVVDAGVPYARGDALAEIRDIAGRAVDVVRAPEDGVVVSWADGLWVRAGSAVATVAVRGQ